MLFQERSSVEKHTVVCSNQSEMSLALGRGGHASGSPELQAGPGLGVKVALQQEKGHMFGSTEHFLQT